MIIILFLVGFVLGLSYSLIGEKLPLLIPNVPPKEDNSWILNLCVGIANSLVVLFSHYTYGFSYNFFIACIISALVLIIFISDFKYMIILDSPLIIASILVLILKYYFFDLKSVGISLLSGLILFLFMFIMSLIGKKAFKKEALGGGDIKLGFIIGLILDFKLGLASIILSSLLAMPYAVASLLLSHENREVPFGPFLISGMAIVFMFITKFTNLINFLF